MVIKQTKKTRAKQRKQAINNWKKIVRKVGNIEIWIYDSMWIKVIQTIDRVGCEHAVVLLHSHDRMVEEATALKVYSRYITITFTLLQMEFSGRIRSPSNRIATSRRVKSPEGIVKEGRKDGDKRNIDTLRLDRDEVDIREWREWWDII